MDDLNGDGRTDERDAAVLYRLFDDAQGSGGLGNTTRPGLMGRSSMST